MIRVLCIDDDLIARQFITSRLEMEGDFSLAQPVAGVSEALAILRSEPIDVVVLDYHLIGGTGVELLEQLRDDPSREVAGCPRFLICTGWATPEREQQARSAGAAGMVGKLELSRELAEAVRTVAAGGLWFKSDEDRRFPTVPSEWRILVAEPDRATRALLAQALEQIGCRVDYAWDGAEVIEQLEAGPYQLIFLSHRLPGPPRATEVLETVESRWPDLRVLLLAPDLARQEVPQSRAVRGLVARPFDARGLQEQLLKAVGS